MAAGTFMYERAQQCFVNNQKMHLFCRAALLKEHGRITMLKHYYLAYCNFNLNDAIRYPLDVMNFFSLFFEKKKTSTSSPITVSNQQNLITNIFNFNMVQEILFCLKKRHLQNIVIHELY